MAENGATQKRSVSSTLSGTEQTATLTPSSSRGDSYFTGAFKKEIFPTYSQVSRVKTTFSKETLNDIDSSSGGYYYVSSLFTYNTDMGFSAVSRYHTTLTLTGFLIYPPSTRGSTYFDSAIVRDEYNTCSRMYFLACYDSNGVRHYWVDYAPQMKYAPTLTGGASYVESTFVVLSTF